MKALLFLLSAGLLLTGCESDVAPGTEVPGKFQRGIRGEGTLYQSDRSSVPGSPNYDPMIREDARTGN